MQLILVSGLSGAGKSIALDVLEDGGYYCVDNLPATLLEDVARYLGEAGHERVALSVDARSAALLASTLTATRSCPASPRKRSTSISSVAGRLSTQ